jgi:hypothetical protein
MPVSRDSATMISGDMAEPLSQIERTAIGHNDQNAKRQDLLRRFALTPEVADIQLMGRIVRLEANNRAVLDLARSFFRSHQVGTGGTPDFLWRIFCETDTKVDSTAVPLSAFSDRGLQYVAVGQRGFLAVDFESREAAAFFSDQFIEGAARFRHRPPLDILFCMTASSLGLTTLSGGCVGLNDRGILILGPPNSGKTTASYLASTCGMRFHADQVIFLDMKDNLLRVWGDPFPAVFRPQTTEFLPELRQRAVHSTYGHLEFYYFDKSPLQPQLAPPLIPVCALFLNRNATGENQLTRISKAELLSRLHEYLLFDEDERFDRQASAALSACSKIPIYELKYREDPKIAAGVIKELLL